MISTAAYTCSGLIQGILQLQKGYYSYGRSDQKLRSDGNILRLQVYLLFVSHRYPVNLELSISPQAKAAFGSFCQIFQV